jgi:hypothetical protein
MMNATCYETGQADRTKISCHDHVLIRIDKEMTQCNNEREVV